MGICLVNNSVKKKTCLSRYFYGPPQALSDQYSFGISQYIGLADMRKAYL